MTLFEFLEKKPLYYNEIDYERMPSAYESIKNRLKIPKIIQIIGTNGKGSTGRFIADMLLAKGVPVGHYTSPHILKFNERIWLNGKNANDEILEQAHIDLQEILPQKFINSLSYFEYTTFLAVLILSKKCEYIILEAGLGGEYDATSVFPKILSVVTPIGHDHHDFLGNSIEEIATTKLNSVAKKVIMSRQSEKEVYEVARKICDKKQAQLYLCEEFLKHGAKEEIKDIVKKYDLPPFQEINLKTASCVVDLLGFRVDFPTISILQGRCQKIAKNITVDVGHNPLAAKELVNFFKDKKVTLVYNSFINKEYEQILDILMPIIEKIEILPLENERRVATDEIRKICEEKSIKVSDFSKIYKKYNYLVFGSFVVVEKFLRIYKKHEK